MIPVAFSGCRGWYHPATGNAGQRPGIVFFPAFGVEDLATRQSLLRLAEDLSAIGHPVLRFDLPGTGDAIGEMNEITSLATWISAGRAALASLGQLCGQPAPILLGLRLGGLLACLVAAAERADGRPIAGLALLAPVLDGRRHLRELRTLANAETPLTVAGFPLPDLLCAEISKITPGDFAETPAPAIFLGLSSASPQIEQLLAGWQNDARICRHAYDDLSGHIGNPTLSRSPATLFAACRDWCQALPLAAEVSPAKLPSPPEATLSAPGWHEHAELLDIENGIAAIWCQPSPPARAADSTTLVVFCNAGRNPHHGWARSSVTMARRLAAEGIPSLRFDLPGLGDSPPPRVAPAEILYSNAAIPYLRAVIDVIEKRHARRPLCLVGSCSGAHLAFHTATADPRIAGLLMINIQRFIWTPGTSLVATMRSTGRSTSAYRQRALSLETWKRLFRGDIDLPSVIRPLLARTSETLRRALPGSDGMHQRAARRAIQEKMAGLSQRGTRVTMIFAEDDGGRDEFARHFGVTGQAFSRQPGSRLVILPAADHDLTPQASRAQLYEEILILARALR